MPRKGPQLSDIRRLWPSVHCLDLGFVNADAFAADIVAQELDGLLEEIALLEF